MNNEKDIIGVIDLVRNAKRIYRDQASDEILRNPELLSPLIRTVFSSDAVRSVKAAWILELVCLYEPKLLIPYIQLLASNLKKITNESALRPLSKIGSLMSKEYFLEPWEDFDPDAPWINALVSQNFEWLSGDHKVAAKVFAMESLYYWGIKFDWVHEELIFRLQKDFRSGSSGYQSRARKILDKIYQTKGPKT